MPSAGQSCFGAIIWIVTLISSIDLTEISTTVTIVDKGVGMLVENFELNP